MAAGGKHDKFGSTLIPYPGSLRAIQGRWAPQRMDEQVVGANHAVVIGSHEVVRLAAEVVTAMYDGGTN